MSAHKFTDMDSALLNPRAGLDGWIMKGSRWMSRVIFRALTFVDGSIIQRTIIRRKHGLL